MKHVGKYILLVLTLIHVTACENWLELIPPDGLVQDEYWRSKEDVEAVLMGAYQKFAGLDEKLFLLGEIRADMITYDQNTPSSERSIIQGNIYPDNQMCKWTDFYTVIHYCNSVLLHAPEIQEIDPTFSEYKMKGFEAEAIFLRSLAYFYLVRTFKDVPLVLQPTETDGVELFLTKSADSTILRQIKADLEEARYFVTDDYGSVEENIGRARKGAILSLLADISLWNFDYEDCVQYINEIEELEYAMIPGNQWFRIFYPGNSLEGIFEFQFNQNLEQSNSMWGYTYYINKYYLTSAKALERLDQLNAREVIRGPGSLRSTDGMIWKYAGAAADGKTLRSGSERNSCNWIVYRLADVLLMKAEALSQLNEYDESLAIINQVRTRAGLNQVNIAYNREAFEEAILEERARELAFEGKRWFDLMRMGRRDNYNRKSKLIEIIIENVPSTQKLVLASKLTDPNGWYLPIFENELERNSKLVQNPFYAAYSTD
jgi:hypothetical protein